MKSSNVHLYATLSRKYDRVHILQAVSETLGYWMSCLLCKAAVHVVFKSIYKRQMETLSLYKTDTHLGVILDS